MWRPLADRAYARPLVAFARATPQGPDGAQALSETTPLANFSALFSPLPEHVQLLTLQELRPGRLLLRLAHQLAIGEDATLAQVDLATLFDRKMLSVALATKRSLTNAHSQSELLRRRVRAHAWHTAGEPHAWRQLEYNFSSNATAASPRSQVLVHVDTYGYELEAMGLATGAFIEGDFKVVINATSASWCAPDSDTYRFEDECWDLPATYCDKVAENKTTYAAAFASTYLFDLAADPLELYDLAQSHKVGGPKKVGELRMALRAWTDSLPFEKACGNGCSLEPIRRPNQPCTPQDVDVRFARYSAEFGNVFGKHQGHPMCWPAPLLEG